MSKRRFAGLAMLIAATSGCGGGGVDHDAALADGAAIDAPSDALADAPTTGRELLSQVGLYADIANKALADGVVEFSPTHTLWTDGAVKTRWIKLPAGTQIDTSDMDRWVFPVGTKVFKEFVRDGVLIETRLIEKTGPGPMDYWMGTFVWALDESDAVVAPDGRIDANGTDHDVPDVETCWACHLGEPNRVLGFSAVQLSRAGAGLTLASLATAGLLTDPPPNGESYPAPGDSTEAAALGYLHANCGHCHNSYGLAWPDTDMELRLRVAERTPADTAIYQSTVNVALQKWMHETITMRVAAGDASASAIAARMATRGDRDEMPPFGTEIVDPDGLAEITAWITALATP